MSTVSPMRRPARMIAARDAHAIPVCSVYSFSRCCRGPVRDVRGQFNPAAVLLSPVVLVRREAGEDRVERRITQQTFHDLVDDASASKDVGWLQKEDRVHRLALGVFDKRQRVLDTGSVGAASIASSAGRMKGTSAPYSLDTAAISSSSVDTMTRVTNGELFAASTL